MNGNGEITEASVLVPVYRTSEGDCKVVLVRRSENGIHGGEIAFPGGKRKTSDRTLLDTALREVREEIGLTSEFIDIVEALPPVDTISTRFRIYPFLARIVPSQPWVPDRNEIADILEVSVKSLADPGVHGEETRVFPGFPGPLHIRFYRIGSHKLWGATYRILQPIIPRLLANECDSRQMP